MATRRTALVTLAAGSASAALARSLGGEPHEHAGHDDASGKPEHVKESAKDRKPVFFKGREYETLVRLTDLILPRTDTAGAAEVGVPWRIDHTVFQKKELQPLYRNGLAGLDAAAKKRGKPDFLSLTDSDQVAVLTALSTSADRQQAEFFQSLKGLTIEWFYNTEEGLAHELGFKGNTFRSEFPGCTHPEHWPEQRS